MGSSPPLAIKLPVLMKSLTVRTGQSWGALLPPAIVPGALSPQCHLQDGLPDWCLPGAPGQRSCGRMDTSTWVMVATSYSICPQPNQLSRSTSLSFWVTPTSGHTPSPRHPATRCPVTERDRLPSGLSSSLFLVSSPHTRPP